MAYLIAIVAVLMVLGSVLWLKPSAADRRQTELRLLARQLGIEVHLCTLPQCRRARVREERPEQGVVYRLPIYERRDIPLPEYLLCRDNASAPWSVETPAELTSKLQALVDKACTELPADTVAIELGPQGPAVYWRERGDQDTLRRLYKTLADLRAELLGEPA